MLDIDHSIIMFICVKFVKQNWLAAFFDYSVACKCLNRKNFLVLVVVMVISYHFHIGYVIFFTRRFVVGLSVLQVMFLELCVETLEYPIILNFFEGGLFLSLVNEGMNHLENAFGARVVRHFPVVLIFKALLWPVAFKGLLLLFGKIFVFRQTVEAFFPSF